MWRRHWWNGKWGRLVRRDIKIYKEADGWRVEATEGGAEGESRSWIVPEEADALALATELMSDGEGWRALSMPTPPR